MPEANRPFLEGETYVNENRDIIRFHQIMENFNKIDVAFLANPRGKICEGVLGLHFDAFL